MTTETPGTRIQAKREAAGLTRAQLGEHCQWHDQGGRRVRRYETGERTPDWQDARALADALGTTVGHLMYGEEETTRVEQLPVISISGHLRNPRKHFDDDQLAQLADSIREHGILQPITVATSGPNYVVICGERRLRAARMAGLDEIPAIVRDDIGPEQHHALQIVENLQRVNLSLGEIVAGVDALCRDHSHDDVARMLGRSRSWVSRRHGIGNLNDKVRKAVRDGDISDVDAAHLLDQLLTLDFGWAIKLLNRFDASVETLDGKPTRAEIQEAVDTVKGWRNQAGKDRSPGPDTGRNQHESDDAAHQGDTSGGDGLPPAVTGNEGTTGHQRPETPAADKAQARQQAIDQLHTLANQKQRDMRALPGWDDHIEVTPDLDINPDADDPDGYAVTVRLRNQIELDNLCNLLTHEWVPRYGTTRK
ncbi:ParB/RepB/Spo0J family partition protein [Spectribacter hydrogenoxidans]|uniref:ParB/RepB/Spo0J family partition protein n=1 Tax=Spectribacter hydrogenoxidans TaxID=3075608 RepID=A0ABU3C0I5_9GAMM|nr:ParB/RepB/Spo0J family partition protein [Salinisphaera sp. W335]MDT0635067.1 ParB/RepB/Spo0J family partition protein [Salinisphaera sp. W335]